MFGCSRVGRIGGNTNGAFLGKLGDPDIGRGYYWQLFQGGNPESIRKVLDRENNTHTREGKRLEPHLQIFTLHTPESTPGIWTLDQSIAIAVADQQGMSSRGKRHGMFYGLKPSPAPDRVQVAPRVAGPETLLRLSPSREKICQGLNAPHSWCR